MTKEQREQIKHLKSECNMHKSHLLGIARKIEAISPRQAEELNRIIGRLEHWQNK